MSLETETDGSIVCPATGSDVVGIKPSVGLTSRAGVVPIAASQDTVGPHGRTVADAAAVLGALTGLDVARDPATGDSAGNARDLGGKDGIDAALASESLDALIAPTGSPMWPIDLVNGDHFLGASSGAASIAGYSLIAVPAGHSFGLPVGITFMGTKWDEPKLIKLASGFEHATKARQKPKFLPTLPLDGGGKRRHGRDDRKKHSQRKEGRACLI